MLIMTITLTPDQIRSLKILLDVATDRLCDIVDGDYEPENSERFQKAIDLAWKLSDQCYETQPKDINDPFNSNK